jgi:Flp pilus assembly pilin Flp
MRRKRGQSVLEYALLITAVALAVVYGANKIIAKKVKTNMDTAGGVIDKADSELKNATGIESEEPAT